MLCVLPLPALSSTCSSDQLLYSPLGVFVPSLPTVSWMEREQGDLISLSRWLHTMSLPTLHPHPAPRRTAASSHAPCSAIEQPSPLLILRMRRKMHVLLRSHA